MKTFVVTHGTLPSCKGNNCSEHQKGKGQTAVGNLIEFGLTLTWRKGGRTAGNAEMKIFSKLTFERLRLSPRLCCFELIHARWVWVTRAM